MTTRQAITLEKTALVVIDMVNWQVPRSEGSDGMSTAYFVEQLRDLVIPNNRRLLSRCRDLGVKVVFLRVGSALEDYSDGIRPLKKLFADYGCREGAATCDVIEELRPRPSEVSLIKLGSGGFNSSGLDFHLRNAGVEHVLYTGVVTNGCVLLTAAAGFDLGYSGYVVSDAVTSYNGTLHEAGLLLLDAYLAEVRDTDGILKMLDAAAVGAPRL